MSINPTCVMLSGSRSSRASHPIRSALKSTRCNPSGRRSRVRSPVTSQWDMPNRVRLLGNRKVSIRPCRRLWLRSKKLSPWGSTSSDTSPVNAFSHSIKLRSVAGSCTRVRSPVSWLCRNPSSRNVGGSGRSSKDPLSWLKLSPSNVSPGGRFVRSDMDSNSL